MDKWDECLLLFYSLSKCANDLEVIQVLCTRYMLQLYVEESKSTINYLISGKTLVIDMSYAKKQEYCINEDRTMGDTQSIGSSIVQVGKEKQEIEVLSPENKKLKEIKLTLLEEKWSVYFKLFTTRLFMYFRSKEYDKAGELIHHLLQYDKEEGRNFAAVVNELTSLEKEIGATISMLESTTQFNWQLNYSLIDHKPCLIFSPGGIPGLLSATILVSATIEGTNPLRFRFFSEYMNEDSMMDMCARLRRDPVVFHLLSESHIYGIPVQVKKTEKDTGVILTFVAEIDKVDSHIQINGDLEVMVDGVLDKHKTLILKRTESLNHVIWHTNLEVLFNGDSLRA